MARLIADMARWLRGLLFYLVVPAALAALLAWEFLLPAFVERIAGDWLADQGLGDFTFEVRHVGLTRAEITGLSGDAGRLAISDITAFYDLAGLSNGRVDRVVIGGARWRTEFEDGRFRLGPFERFLGKPDTRGAATSCSRRPRGSDRFSSPRPSRRASTRWPSIRRPARRSS